jgi:hypothetical protein
MAQTAGWNTLQNHMKLHPKTHSKKKQYYQPRAIHVKSGWWLIRFKILIVLLTFTLSVQAPLQATDLSPVERDYIFTSIHGLLKMFSLNCYDLYSYSVVLNFFTNGNLNTYSIFCATPITLPITAIFSRKHLSALN